MHSSRSDLSKISNTESSVKSADSKEANGDFERQLSAFSMFPVSVKVSDKVKPVENTVYYKAFGLGFFISGLQIAAGYAMPLIFGGGPQSSFSLAKNSFLLAAASGFARKCGKIYGIASNRFEQYVVQGTLHVGTSVGLVIGYRAAVEALGGDMENPFIIPATMALEGCVAPLAERAVEKIYFGSKFLLFKCVGATRSLCDDEPNHKKDGTYSRILDS